MLEITFRFQSIPITDLVSFQTDIGATEIFWIIPKIIVLPLLGTLIKFDRHAQIEERRYALVVFVHVDLTLLIFPVGGTCKQYTVIIAHPNKQENNILARKKLLF